ncbi:MAG: hypothetical protein CVV42_11330 [Candidatus Riflebacteria bacterium HGW-Riflebacteria-2]|nr:MAG: hypothetical protein CVV42_11330 [Candidatus Riflebacteria bacterium HGW-Riflebacteria-2]
MFSNFATLLHKKGPFLLLVQFAVFSVVLLYFCRTVFQVDFAAFDALFGGIDTGILWGLLILAFIVYVVKAGNKSGFVVYVRMPAALFIVFLAAGLAFGSMGIWFFGVLLLFSGLIWFLQVLLVSRFSWLMLFFYVTNLCLTLALYIDQVHYLLTREHLNFYYIRILRTFNTGFFDSLANAGLTPSMYLLPVGVLVLMIALSFPVLRYGAILELPRKKLYSFGLFLLFLPLHFQFHLFAPEIPITEYMNFRLRNFWFPLPDPPIFNSINNAGLIIPADIGSISEKAFARQPEFSWLNQHSEKNVVIILIETMRQDFMMQYMPRTLALAEEGIQCRNHLSNANDTEGSLLALYYGILPLVPFRSDYETKSSAWIEFMKNSGYEFTRISGSSGSLFYPDYRYVHFREYFQEHALSAPPKTSYDENSRLQCDAVIHMLKNSDKKSLVEAYLFHMHYPFWYPERLEKYTPVLKDNSEIMTLDFAESAARLANRYRNSVLYTDELISDFVARLKEEGLYDNTLLVIMGDHGEMLGEDGKIFHANGGEILQYHTSFIVLGKDVPAAKIDKMTSHVDIVPTIGRLLGFSSTGGFGRDVLSKQDNGVVTFDLSGPNRMIYRDSEAASLFYWSGGLAWILTCSADFRLDEKLETFYAPQNLSATLSIAEEHARKLVKILSDD